MKRRIGSPDRSERLKQVEILRGCFLKTLWDTDATDFTDPARTEKTLIKRLLSVVSVYRKDGNNDLRNTLLAGSMLHIGLRFDFILVEGREEASAEGLLS